MARNPRPVAVAKAPKAIPNDEFSSQVFGSAWLPRLCLGSLTSEIDSEVDTEALVDAEAEAGMTAIMEIIKAIRNMRAEVNAAPGKKAPAVLLVSAELKEVITANQAYIKLLGTVDELTIDDLGSSKIENAMATVVNGVEVYLPLKGLIDVEKETARLQKELDGLQKEIKRIEGKLSNQGFLAKAPAEVVAKEKAKGEEMSTKKQAIRERMDYLKTL